ncbi:MAG: hypothetical protein M3442_04030, partial [Chloroflexota bacterium]|nr:hypothetical protein [Chloroflexota bacterium]
VVERVQDVAEDVVDRAASTARGAYAATISTVAPVITRSGKASDSAWRRSSKQANKPAHHALESSAKLVERAADRARTAYGATRETVSPVLVHSTRAAEGALSKTAGSAAAGLSAAKEAGKDATMAVASTGAAAAGATAGFFGAIGGLLGGLLRGLWVLTVFLVKASILAGIAYAGWQWLESRRQNQSWSSPTYGPSSDGTPGTSATTSYPGATTPSGAR